MKKILNIAISGLLLMSVTSCNDYLDINQNPNRPLESTAPSVLPQAITTTANNIRQYDDYGSQVVGYFANGGGVSGWGSIISYNYTTSDFRTLWSDTYNNLMDYEYIIKQTTDVPEDAYFNAVAKIMKAYNFQLLVDTYNDVPYSQAFQGAGLLAVPYDSGQDVYKNITDLVDEAISSISGADPEVVTEIEEGEDPLFKGEMDSWLQFAQTLKLKLILRANGKVEFSNETFDPSIGFLEEDAIVNPGYQQADGKQNRMWDTWAYSYTGAARGYGSQYVPTPFILSFYDGTKIDDAYRGSLTYISWPGVATNQLGYQGADAARGESPNTWFMGDYGVGIFKGPDMGQPLFLAAEVYLMVAEANVRGLVDGDAKTNFNASIEKSIEYLYKGPTGTPYEDSDPAEEASEYLQDNQTNRLVNFDLATTDEQKIEAIITQKYIAQNMIFGHESWNDFRRTGYPVSVSNPSGNATTSMVSITSGATTPNRLPNRILYPASEFSYNPQNAKTIDPNTDKIFWAK